MIAFAISLVSEFQEESTTAVDDKMVESGLGFLP
jgi:hypothetical protein